MAELAEIEAMIRRTYQVLLIETSMTQDDAYILAVKIVNALLRDK